MAPAPMPLRMEPTAPSTRALLGDPLPDGEEMDLPDPEERRLSHELSFGDTERQLSAGPRPRSFRRIWVAILTIIIVIIAAILFQPQLVSAFPALDRLYALVGL
jgi:hypothetical protein